jgi:hypothetical protein
MDINLFTNENCPNCTIHAPREAYFFIPNLENQMIYDPKNPKRSLRLIFDKRDKSEYLEHENESYEKFQRYFEENYNNSFIIPEDWTESETRKCIQASNFDNGKALQKMKSCIEFPIPICPFNEIRDIFSSGFIYMHGLDSNYRPIICIVVSKFVKIMDAYPINNFIYAIYFFIKYLSKHIFIPGQVENWVMFADLSEVSFWKPPTKILKIFDFLQSKYLCRLSSLYIYGMNYVLTMCWKIIKKLIDERTAQKFNFISGDNDIRELVLSKINPTQLERRFGGSADNIPDEIDFPFLLPSDEYQVNDSNEDQIVSEEEYIQMANNEKLVTISPYLIQEGKIKPRIINNDREANLKKENINIIYNKNGNPVYNDIEFFECQSNIDSELDNSNLNDEINDNYKLRGKNKIKDSDNEEKTNTVFEMGEEKANGCKCSTCLIF